MDEELEKSRPENQQDEMHSDGDSPVQQAGRNVFGIAGGAIKGFLLDLGAKLLVVWWQNWLVVLVISLIVIMFISLPAYILEHPIDSTLTYGSAVGREVVNYVGDRFHTALDKMGEAAGDMFKSATDSLKNFLGIEPDSAEADGYIGEELLGNEYIETEHLAYWNGDRDLELKENLKKKLHKDGSSGAISAETEGGGEELSPEELNNVSDEVMLLANVLKGEIGGGSLEEIVAVGTVIMNRVKSDKFPNTLTGVITAPKQFDGYVPGRSNSSIPSRIINIAYNIIYNGLRIKGWSDDVIGFQNPYSSSVGFVTTWNGWHKYAELGKKPFVHWFYSISDQGDGHDAEASEGEDSPYDPVVRDGAGSGPDSEAARREDPTLAGIWGKYLIENKDAGIKVSGGERSVSENGYWYLNNPVEQLMDNTHPMAAQQDIIDLTKFCAEYNNKMFELGDLYYEYLQWNLVQFKNSYGATLYKWEESWPSVSTTGIKGDNDGLYGKVSREHIEGEEDGSGYKKFMLWWQEVQGLYYVLTNSNGKSYKEDGWGNTGDEYEFDSKIHEERIDDPLDTDGYFANDQSISEIENLLKFQFRYYYDAVKVTARRTKDKAFRFDKLHSPENKGLKQGDYKPIAYRYKRLPDPDPIGPFYDPPDIQAPYTRFTPESAPNTISNSFTTYKYIYVPVSKLQGVKAKGYGSWSYTPDPDKYEPPQGFYCIGRYKIVNPGPFLDALSDIEDTFRSNHMDGWAGLGWAEWQMKEFAELTSELPVLKEYQNYFLERLKLYQELGKMYSDEKVDITYEGVLYKDIYDEKDMTKFIANYKKVLPSKYSSWHFPSASKIIEDPRSRVTIDEFLDPDADPGAYPFWSYGVTFFNGKDLGEQAVTLTGSEYDLTQDWNLEYEDPLEIEDEEFDYEFDGARALENFMQWYLNQGDYPNVIRGLSGKRVSQSGCLDCSVAMIVSYWLGQHVPIQDISQYVLASGALDTPRVLAKYGLKQSGNNYNNFFDGVKSEIDSGRPVIVHIRGYWSGSDGTVYHSTSNGHFLVCYGYDENGLLVADPGRRANHHIKTSDWGRVSDLYYRSVTEM